MSELGRRTLLKSASIAAGGLILTGNAGLAAPAAAPVVRRASRPLNVRWFGGGVVEVATPDNKQVAFVDAWVWNNTAYTVQKVERPADLSSAEAFAEYVAAKSPDAVLVLLTHDHGDHMGDYFRRPQGSGWGWAAREDHRAERPHARRVGAEVS